MCISDLKCVLNVAGMARHFVSIPVDQNQKQQHDNLAAVHPAGGVDNLTIHPGDIYGKCDCALDDWIKVS